MHSPGEANICPLYRNENKVSVLSVDRFKVPGADSLQFLIKKDGLFGSTVWIVPNDKCYASLARIFLRYVKFSEKTFDPKSLEPIVEETDKDNALCDISPEFVKEEENAMKGKPKEEIENPLEPADKKSTARPVIGVSVFVFFLAGEDATAVFLFGLKNNTLQVAFYFAKSALTFPGFGVLAEAINIGFGIAVLLFTKKAISNSDYNKSLTINDEVVKPPKLQ